MENSPTKHNERDGSVGGRPNKQMKVIPEDYEGESPSKGFKRSSNKKMSLKQDRSPKVFEGDTFSNKIASLNDLDFGENQLPASRKPKRAATLTELPPENRLEVKARTLKKSKTVRFKRG
mmetsp:Transcript_39344/g.35029  ORF Transcript_39344/g.35029 Transcript_39344/m.35029 type:complete len:120 (-) Transcript_39344:1429-1788(-)|eukprot:CAMPEP_0114593532 /NCGR_PEP_ID=MMETSP0125-20121206/15128_1 /TAXON_ID=485358 ORGANISM="Aristerostoma sp., Strain ATCC 50986" /NCGR_SAMPLE_ID=MMETSP0125 /ASSEMBLY_ACC=CAM_ASM_000245 /LENGTH=119 /DNA_ID=CAMNT_0001792809 /DNA_START=1289 /DNA_END=1648 /DNA_ORIENTATION=-